MNRKKTVPRTVVVSLTLLWVLFWSYKVGAVIYHCTNEQSLGELQNQKTKKITYLRFWGISHQTPIFFIQYHVSALGGKKYYMWKNRYYIVFCLSLCSPLSLYCPLFQHNHIANFKVLVAYKDFHLFQLYFQRRMWSDLPWRFIVKLWGGKSWVYNKTVWVEGISSVSLKES